MDDQSSTENPLAAMVHTAITEPSEMYNKMVAGEMYKSDDPYIQQLQTIAQQLQHMANSTALVEDAQPILHMLFKTIGENTTVRQPIYVDYGRHISIGSDGFINYGLVALDVAPITIGNRCQIATNVQLLTATHPTDPVERATLWEQGLPITIEDDVWIGGGAIILPGITIGKGSIIGAGAVVTKDVPPGVIVAGNPAKIIRNV